LTRRGYVLTICLIVSLLIFALAGVIAQYAAIEIRRERSVALDSLAEQLFQSARAWSGARFRQMKPGEAAGLPCEGLLPGGITGTLVVAGIEPDGGIRRVTCRVELQRGGERLAREETWGM